MLLCLGCRRVSPAGSVFCAFCNRTFGGRRCTHGHLSPPTARCCVQCGVPDAQMTQATGVVSLDVLPRLLSGLCVTALLAGLAFGAWNLRGPLLHAAAPLTASASAAATGVLRVVIFWTVFLYVLSNLVPGKVGNDLRGLSRWIVKTAVSLVVNTVRSAVRGAAKGIAYGIAALLARRGAGSANGTGSGAKGNRP